MHHLLSFLKHHQNIKSLAISSDPYLEPRSTQRLLFSNLPNGLQDLKVNVEFYASSDYTALIQTISQRLPSLRALNLVLSSLDSWNLASFEDLSPFLQFSNLEELTLWVSGGIQFTTGDIYTLGRALPKMARLRLRRDYALLPAVGIPASSLMDFAKAFPNIHSLCIHITHIDIPLPPASTNDEAQITAFNPATFRLLDVGESSLAEKEVPLIAGLLGMLCRHPLFEIQYSEKNDAKGSTAAWKRAEALLKQATFAAVTPNCRLSERFLPENVSS